MTTMNETQPIDQAEAQFAEQSLPFPPLPENFAGKLQPFGESVFSTRDLEYGPYSLESYSGEIRDGNAVDDYAVVGFDGHGMNSWAAHYFLVEGPLALFIQIGWGGAYTEEDEARADIEEAFNFAKSLQGAMQRAAAQGHIPAGERLVVVISDITESAWGWVKPGDVNTPWHDDGDIYAEVANALVTLFPASP